MLLIDQTSEVWCRSLNQTTDRASIDSWLESWEPAIDEGHWSSKRILEHTMSSKVCSVGAGFGSDILEALVIGRRLVDVFEVDFLATLARSRGRGLMKAVLMEVIEIYSPQAIWLEVHDQNHQARSFYKAIGFAQVGERPSYYQGGFKAILLELKL